MQDPELGAFVVVVGALVVGETPGANVVVIVPTGDEHCELLASQHRPLFESQEAPVPQAEQGDPLS